MHTNTWIPVYVNEVCQVRNVLEMSIEIYKHCLFTSGTIHWTQQGLECLFYGMLKACQLHNTSATWNFTLSHTHTHTHKHAHTHTHTHTHTHSNVHRWKKQTNESHAFPKPHLNNCMHICTFKQQWFYINRHTKHFLYKQKHSFKVHRLRHHLLSCTLLVLHTFLSSMHSSRCSPDATHHWPFILQTKKSMFIPIAWAHTPTRLQREAEMRKGIKKLLFSPLLWP